MSYIAKHGTDAVSKRLIGTGALGLGLMIDSRAGVTVVIDWGKPYHIGTEYVSGKPAFELLQAKTLSEVKRIVSAIVHKAANDKVPECA